MMKCIHKEPPPLFEVVVLVFEDCIHTGFAMEEPVYSKSIPCRIERYTINYFLSEKDIKVEDDSLIPIRKPPIGWFNKDQFIKHIKQVVL